MDSQSKDSSLTTEFEHLCDDVKGPATEGGSRMSQDEYDDDLLQGSSLVRAFVEAGILPDHCPVTSLTIDAVEDNFVSLTAGMALSRHQWQKVAAELAMQARAEDVFLNELQAKRNFERSMSTDVDSETDD